jgi:hypothetical protein
MKPPNVIADRPSDEMYRAGLEIDCQCARCGSSVDCAKCDCDDGFTGHECGEDTCCCLDPEPNVVCQMCWGAGVWHRCISSDKYCQENPLPGRENIERGKIEWYCFEERPCQP